MKRGEYTRRLGESLTKMLEKENYLKLQVFYDHGKNEPNVCRPTLYFGEKCSRDTTLSFVDIAVVESGKVKVLCEIEEKGASPKKIIGNIVSVLLAEKININNVNLGEPRIVLGIKVKAKGKSAEKIQELKKKIQNAVKPEFLCKVKQIPIIVNNNIEEVIDNVRKEVTRLMYKPEKINVLFVGESIPAGGKFFYDANSRLYRATAEAFNEIYRCGKDHPFLTCFKKLGFYLEDLCLEPVNNLDPKTRYNKCQESVPILAKRIEEMRPSAIVVVMKDISHEVRQAAKQASLSDVRFEELPFPSYHREGYIKELKEVLKGFIEEGILQPPEALS